MSKKVKIFIVILLLVGTLIASLVFANSTTSLQGFIFKFVPKVSITKIPKAQIDPKLVNKLWEIEGSKESGTRCGDSIDNDKDGFFDCYDPDCKDYNGGYNYTCSEYQNSKTYQSTDPIITLHPHDKIRFPDGMIAEMTKGMDVMNTASFLFYYEINGQRISHSQKAKVLYPLNASFTWAIPAPYLSYANIYMHLINLDTPNKEAQIEIFDNCTDLYNSCIQEPGANDNFKNWCEKLACPYEAFNSSLERKETEHFISVFPKEDKIMAEKILSKADSCYEKINTLFGDDHLQKKLGLRFFNKYHTPNNIQGGATETGVIYLEYEGNLEEALQRVNMPWDDNSDDGDCYSPFPLAHELTHIFAFDPIFPFDTFEGFGNYLGGKANEETFMICEDYDYHYRGTSYTDAYPKYADETNVYVIGDCFWKLLEQKYGWPKISAILSKMAELRNVAKSTPYSFISDILVPVLGKDEIANVQEIADRFNGRIEIDCTKLIGTYDTGLSCK